MANTWPGTPQPAALIRDALIAVRAQFATTITLILVLGTVCFAILVTTGQAAANEAAIVAQIDGAGTRMIPIFDDGGTAEILPTAPAFIETLADVEWAFGMGEAIDIANPALPDGRAAARVFVGQLPAEMPIIRGRLPRPGEAIVGVGAASSLHLGAGLGRVQAINQFEPSDLGSQPIGVVGVFEPSGPLAVLANTVLVSMEPAQVSQLRFVYVMAENVNVVDRLETVLRTSTPALNPGSVIVETPTGAIALREVIAGRLGAASRQLMAVVMGVGAVLIAVTMFAATMARRRDFGRRRALGATRSTLVVGLLMQTAVSACLGIAIGTGLGIAALQVTTSHLPTWQFTAGVAGLALILTLVAALPIAIVAATRDPLRILRVP